MVPTHHTALDLSNPIKCSPIFIYALHLVELTGRASNMHEERRESAGARVMAIKTSPAAAHP